MLLSLCTVINQRHEPELDDAWVRLQQSVSKHHISKWPALLTLITDVFCIQHMELSALLERYNTLHVEYKRLTDVCGIQVV